MSEMVGKADRSVSVTDVERAPTPGEPPVPHAQWNEVERQWELWDAKAGGWVAASDGGTGQWAAQFADAVRAEFTQRAQQTEITLRSVEAVSLQAVEVVYAWPGEDTLRGIRLDLSSVERASERIRTSSVGELAFDVVLAGMMEPRAIEDFAEPDASGIRWLPAHEWLDP